MCDAILIVDAVLAVDMPSDAGANPKAPRCGREASAEPLGHRNVMRCGARPMKLMVSRISVTGKYGERQYCHSDGQQGLAHDFPPRVGPEALAHWRSERSSSPRHLGTTGGLTRFLRHHRSRPRRCMSRPNAYRGCQSQLLATAVLDHERCFYDVRGTSAIPLTAAPKTFLSRRSGPTRDIACRLGQGALLSEGVGWRHACAHGQLSPSKKGKPVENLQSSDT